MDKTKIKLLTEVGFLIDDNRPEDEKQISITRYECCSCGWQFWGDCARGVDGNSEGVQTPNYCPMCGRKIEDNFA